MAFIELHDQDSGDRFIRNLDHLGEFWEIDGQTWLSIPGMPSARPVRESYEDIRNAIDAQYVGVIRLHSPIDVPPVSP